MQGWTAAAAWIEFCHVSTTAFSTSTLDGIRNPNVVQAVNDLSAPRVSFCEPVEIAISLCLHEINVFLAVENTRPCLPLTDSKPKQMSKAVAYF